MIELDLRFGGFMMVLLACAYLGIMLTIFLWCLGCGLARSLSFRTFLYKGWLRDDRDIKFWTLTNLGHTLKQAWELATPSMWDDSTTIRGHYGVWRGFGDYTLFTKEQLAEHNKMRVHWAKDKENEDAETVTQG